MDGQSYHTTACNDLARQTIFSVCLLLLLLPTLHAQEKAEKNDEIKFLGNHYKRINDTLYACDIEVTNKDYKDFLGYLLSNDYEKCKIDSSLWQSKFAGSYNYPMVKNYHTHSAFDLYPVVNVSYYGAVKYCEWLTTRYKRLLRKGKVKFQLPSAQEWMLLSNTNPATGFPYSILNGKNKEGYYLENIKAYSNDSISIAVDGGFYTVRTDAYWPNSFGLYNVIGNVAEMTDIENIQKGGSWLDDLNDCMVDKVQTYTTPDPRVGFRVVMIITSK